MDPQTRAYIDRRVRQLSARIDAGEQKLNGAIDTAKDYRPRHVVQPSSSVPANTVTTLDITWSPPITTTDYVVTPNVVTADANTGLVSCQIKNGTKTSTGCTLVIANRTAGAISAGLDVVIQPVPT